MRHTGLSIEATATVRRHWHFYSTKRSGTVQLTELKVPLNLLYDTFGTRQIAYLGEVSAQGRLKVHCFFVAGTMT